MPKRASKAITAKRPKSSTEHWHTFTDILQRLHQEHILIHPEQLAEFMVRHGLPVDLRFVPKHLQQRAKVINANYQGDMARLEAVAESSHSFPFE